MAQKIIREIDLFDFMSFLAWTFLNFLVHYATAHLIHHHKKIVKINRIGNCASTSVQRAKMHMILSAVRMVLEVSQKSIISSNFYINSFRVHMKKKLYAPVFFSFVRCICKIIQIASEVSDLAIDLHMMKTRAF